MRLRRLLVYLSVGAIMLLGACTGSETNQPAPVADKASATQSPAPPKWEIWETAKSVRAPKRKPLVFEGSGELIDLDAATRSPVQLTARGGVILNFAGAEIRDVVRSILGTTLGLNYTIHPKVRGKVTVHTSRPLPRAQLLPALENILRLHGAVIVKVGEFYKVVPADQAVAGAVRPRLGLSPRGSGQGFGVLIVPLEFISAKEMEKILKPFAAEDAILRVDTARNLLLLAGTRDELANLDDIVTIFDVDWLSGMSVALFPLQVADAKSVLSELEKVFGDPEDGPLAGVMRLVPVERLNSILVISPQPAYLKRAGEWIERFDIAADGDEPRLHIYRMQNGRAGDLAQILGEIFAEDGAPKAAAPAARTAPGQAQAETRRSARTTRSTQATQTAQAGQTGPQGRAARGRASADRPPRQPLTTVKTGRIRIIADDNNNALVILATPRDFRMVLAAVRRLDVPPLQVLIEATIAEVTLTDKLRYGLNWFFSRGDSSLTFSDLSTGAISSTFPGFSYVFSTTRWNAVFDTLTSITDVKVISSPQLMVLNNQTAFLQVGDQVPITTQQTTSIADPNAPLVSTIQFRDTGVILEVTPRVNASGMITMEISQEVSDVTSTTSSTLNSPTIQQRKLQSTVAVQSGQTIALGGLKNTKTSSGLPFLSQIPFLGFLFGNKSDDTLRTELLVLITPRVVRNPAESRRVTDELRGRMRALEPLRRLIE